LPKKNYYDNNNKEVKIDEVRMSEVVKDRSLRSSEMGKAVTK